MCSNHVQLVSECGGFYLSYVRVKIELFIISCYCLRLCSRDLHMLGKSCHDSSGGPVFDV